jgi:hypothetical protein
MIPMGARAGSRRAFRPPPQACSWSLELPAENTIVHLTVLEDGGARGCVSVGVERRHFSVRFGEEFRFGDLPEAQPGPRALPAAVSRSPVQSSPSTWGAFDRVTSARRLSCPPTFSSLSALSSSPV